MKSPQLSIVIPVWNRARVVSRLIERVLAQSVRDFELILVNDGSTDDSLAVLKKFAQRDPRVRVISQSNGGPSAARNAGIDQARGEYLMMLDSDDDIDPSMIEKLLGKIQRDKLDLVTCGLKCITYRDGRAVSQVDVGASPLPPRQPREPLAVYVVRLLGVDGRLYNPCNKIYRLDIIRKHHLHYPIGLNFGEDLTFNLHYLRHVKKLDFIYEPLYIYHFDSAGGEFGKSSLIYENRQKNYQELLDFAGDKRSAAMDDYLGWIKYYWFYSFALAVCSSDQKWREKIKSLKQAAQTEKFQPAASDVYIGRKKYFVERFLGLVKRSATALWLFMLASNFLKNNRLFAGLWRRLSFSLTPRQ